jgi:hypothetical protein
MRPAVANPPKLRNPPLGSPDRQPVRREAIVALRIGTGSAWWGDRIEPARRNAEAGDLHYLCFETMAEATVSAA